MGTCCLNLLPFSLFKRLLQNSVCIFLNMTIIGLIATIPYVIMIIYYIRIAKYLKENKNSLSAASKRSQTDLNRVLLVQAIIPILFVILPASTHVISCVSTFDLTFESFICGILYSWIPIGNAIGILCFITAYRTKLKQMLIHTKPPLPRFVSVSAVVTAEA